MRFQSLDRGANSVASRSHPKMVAETGDTSSEAPTDWMCLLGNHITSTLPPSSVYL